MLSGPPRCRQMRGSKPYAHFSVPLAPLPYLMLYIINDGCCLDWDLAKGPAQQVLFLNLLLAWA